MGPIVRENLGPSSRVKRSLELKMQSSPLISPGNRDMRHHPSPNNFQFPRLYSGEIMNLSLSKCWEVKGNREYMPGRTVLETYSSPHRLLRCLLHHYSENFNKQWFQETRNSCRITAGADRANVECKNIPSIFSTK